ncbi:MULTISPECIES: DUF1508 domain-containing protein [unclassified Cellulophaga]|uniref:YegP family protein n=1 Tax=unclassified Cellulophaga TaxID=2634405 RepID=UPI003867610F
MIKYFTDKSGNHTFKLESTNGNTLLESTSYDNKTDLEQVAANLTILVTKPLLFERKTNYKGEFLFMLKDDQGNVVGNSKLYTSEAGMENGIKNLRNIVGPNTTLKP